MSQNGVRDLLNDTILRYVRSRKRQKCVNIPVEVLEEFRRIQRAVGMQDWVIITTAIRLLTEELKKELVTGVNDK